MRLNTILVGAFIVLSLSFLACNGSNGKGERLTFEYSCEELENRPFVVEQIELSVGDSFTLTVCSTQNPEFRWSNLAKISDPTLIQQESHEFIPPQGNKIGAAGKEVWTFVALEEGTTFLSVQCNQITEGISKVVRYFESHITVK